MSKKFLCSECGFVGKPKTYFKKIAYKDHPSDKFFRPPAIWSLEYSLRTLKKYKGCPKCGNTKITSDVPQDK